MQRSRFGQLVSTFASRGPRSDELFDILASSPSEDPDGVTRFARAVEMAVATSEDIVVDDDLQLALFMLYGLAYGGVIETDEDWEWNPALIAARRSIEAAFEHALRTRIVLPTLPQPTGADVAAALFLLAAEDTGPSLSRFIARKATREQAIELVIQRSIYTLKEADTHSWAIPRLAGRSKAALVEIQADEYGGGRPERVHAEIFANTMRALDLNSTYGAYVDLVPAITLASMNMMSMFGMNRRLRGAIVGHLAAFEMTSSIPNRFYGNGFRRLGFGNDVTLYFDEHVEADAVHEQIAARDLAGSLAEDHPGLLGDIFFGAAACLAMDGWLGSHLLGAWESGVSSLLQPIAPAK
ncbi:MAG: hypothetical protein JWO10_1221 [Microbacteriaceae bacterium]|nr:hypothetical protein [Microbacteriaceae bacterium]